MRWMLVFPLAVVGCRSYIEISDVSAERGEAEKVVVRFKADRDVTRAAQFVGALLVIPSADEGVWAEKLVRTGDGTDAPGSSYSFAATFPLAEPEGRRLQYDLSLPGIHELEFEAGGGMCGGPGGFHTNRVRLEYRVP